ncbi:MAG: flagellar motor switch phosphatase FliY [Acetatifactor sp.]|nr:flagellar motor switch phosphatase FliY [Acetatifactor sp.]
MDGMLSQDEIEALLNGMDLSDDGTPEGIGNNEEVTEIPSSGPDGGNQAPEDVLTDIEKDAIGEVANISMGSSATTLYSLVNRKVNITTPVVTPATWSTLLVDYEKPCVFIQIKYTVGLDGTNILVLKEHDVKVITDLMMGGDGTNTDGELGELHLSAISEAMNQMMGSAATSLSTMLKTTIDISPPEASLLDLTQVKNGEEISPFLGGTFIKIAFRMQIDDLVDSTIMQLYPVEFARKVVSTFMGSQDGGDAGPAPQPAAAPEPAPAAPMGMPAQGGQMDMSGMSMGMAPQGMNPQMGMGMNPQGMMPQMGMSPMGMAPQMDMSGMPMGMAPQGMPMMGMAPQGMPMMGMAPQNVMQNVNVQPAQFQSFGGDGRPIQGQENIGLIMDVPLEVTVELGRTTRSISEILNFAPGTIIELDRIAGEPIDVLVNGKFVARGEVVVIEESFSVRVTEIIK